ncbi:MAG TPA: hypothetical protein VNI83_10155 [Vicinamibacterales bacterium]|nr:hypothetical protein [Vicinamibacterales bacterium]
MRQMFLAVALAALLAAGVAAQPPRPATQPSATAGEVSAPEGELNLGTVRIPRRVMADGKPLPAGTYQVRLTPQEAKPDVPGQTEKLERWVEFRQRGEVKGREVVSIVPQAEIGQVAETRPPRPGAAKVELLKGNDYVRVWINRGGFHYLIHLPVG